MIFLHSGFLSKAILQCLRLALLWKWCCCCLVTQPCLPLCNAMDCSMPGFPVLHYLPDFAQIHVHWVSDAIQTSHALLSPSPSAFNLSQNQDLSNESALQIRWSSIGASASASVLPMNIQAWFPLGLTGLRSCCTRDPKASSPAPHFKSINSLAVSLLNGPTLTFIHVDLKNHNFDYMDLCQQSDVSAF